MINLQFMIHHGFLSRIQNFVQNFPQRTPVYIYSQEIFLNNYFEMQNAFKQNLKNDFLIAYSIKSNANETLVKSIIKHGSGVDCVSGGEVLLALKYGCHPSKIVFAGV